MLEIEQDGESDDQGARKLCLEFEWSCLNTITCQPQQNSRKPQAFQKCARSQAEFRARRRPSVTHFGSVTNHFPKKFHFYGKFLSPCSTSNEIIWDLGRNEGKVGRGKAETYKNMSLESLCPLVVMNSFFVS